MKPLVSMRAALDDPQLFGTIFAGKSWAGWRVLLTAIVGEELTADERIVFEGLTGRQREPLEPVDEVWCIFGRRAGKTRSAAILAAYLSALCDHDDTLAIGERGSVANSQRERVAGAKGLQLSERHFRSSSRPQIDGDRQDIRDDCALERYRPGMQACELPDDPRRDLRRHDRRRGCLLAERGKPQPGQGDSRRCAPFVGDDRRPVDRHFSSPYAKRGELWNSYKRDYGAAGDPQILVAKAASRTLNPTLPERVVARAYERDPQAASAEYGAEFRNDVSGFLDFETVEAAIDRGVTVRAPRAGIRYESGCDPSGGARDSFTLAVAHNDNGVAILDCVVGIKPPSHRRQRRRKSLRCSSRMALTKTVGDHYSAEWVVDAMSRVGITSISTPNATALRSISTLCRCSRRVVPVFSTTRAWLRSSLNSSVGRRRTAGIASTMARTAMTTFVIPRRWRS